MNEKRMDSRTVGGVLIARAADFCAGDCKAEQVENCYAGQWTVHPAHDYTILLQKHLGGGKRTVHCPGKTSETVLR